MWLYEARKRFGICILNFLITCNHIHLLVVDTEEDVISKSMQLVAGRTGQEFNIRKGRAGAFWEDRYHATAIDTQDYLWQCMIYIDLNMIRAGAVSHPSEWGHCGYNEILAPPKRYRIIDIEKVVSYFGFVKYENFKKEYSAKIESALLPSNSAAHARDGRWTDAIAVGQRNFLEQIKDKLGVTVKERSISGNEGILALKEPTVAYGGVFEYENGVLRGENSCFLELSY